MNVNRVQSVRRAGEKNAGIINNVTMISDVVLQVVYLNII